MTRLVLFELFVTNLLLFEHQQKKNLLVSWQFSGPYGVTKYGSGWRKDVVNQCLEFQWCCVPQFHSPAPFVPAVTYCEMYHKRPCKPFWPLGCKAGKQKGIGSIPLRLSFLLKKVVVFGHSLVTLSLTINETFKWLSSLPIRQESFWWWQRYSDRYVISLFPHLHKAYRRFVRSPSLISLMVSVDVKHHVYLLCSHPDWTIKWSAGSTGARCECVSLAWKDLEFYASRLSASSHKRLAKFSGGKRQGWWWCRTGKHRSGGF